MTLKISVLASGAILLDGAPVAPDRLDAALDELKAANGTVWYYREPAADPESAGMLVMQKVVARKLPISLSTLPDFSDCVAPAAALDALFAKVRQTAADHEGGPGLVVVRPDRGLFVLPALARSEALDQQAAGMEKFIPSAVKRNIAVIAATAFTLEGSVSLASANQAIPFFGMLIGLSYIGHYVWIFEGDAPSLAAGAREADVLIADSAQVQTLESNWLETAAAAMRNANILLHDRATYKLRILRKVGQAANQLGFK